MAAEQFADTRPVSLFVANIQATLSHLILATGADALTAEIGCVLVDIAERPGQATIDRAVACAAIAYDDISSMSEGSTMHQRALAAHHIAWCLSLWARGYDNEARFNWRHLARPSTNHAARMVAFGHE